MNAQDLLGKMTFEEKAALLTGSSSMMTAGVERLGIPGRLLSDGPHGVRMEGVHTSTHFPNMCVAASTWDTQLLERMGAGIAKDCIQHGISMILGPGINVKRHILCGRNFEYVSEDPLLSGKLAAAYIRGVQGKGVAVSLKHFAANSQEQDRLELNAEMDERTLREIYLRGFEIAVKESSPESVMCAYNKVNAVWCSENPHLLREILKEEWGYNGVVVSDWGAVQDAGRAVHAGLDLIMPHESDLPLKLRAALTAGRVTMEEIDEAVCRVLHFLLKQRPPKDEAFDRSAQHALAREIAAAGVVLLKNDGDALPLTREKYAKIAVVGGYAESPLICGQGSAEVYADPTYIDSPLDAIKKQLPDCEIKFYKGYDKAAYAAEMLWPKMREYMAFIDDCEAVVVFAGSMESEDTENFDRRSAQLNPNFELYIDRACRLGKKVIVVLQTGSAVILGDCYARTDALVQMGLAGEAAGSAIADVLCGAVNPCGRLAETYPACMRRDLEYPGKNRILEYREKLNVGYRYYDQHPKEIVYPFGHGLSYTAFGYSGCEVVQEGERFTVSFELTNIGSVDGSEVVQLYAADPMSTVTKPEKELLAFEKIFLRAGERRRVELSFTLRDLAYYNTSLHDWVTEEGTYRLLVGASSRDIRLEGSVFVKTDMPYTMGATGETMLG